jgi:hypothetical protein
LDESNSTRRHSEQHGGPAISGWLSALAESRILPVGIRFMPAMPSMDATVIFRDFISLDHVSFHILF